MTHNFCESCNRVRITCTGTVHTCLGHEDASPLALKESEGVLTVNVFDEVVPTSAARATA